MNTEKICFLSQSHLSHLINLTFFLLYTWKKSTSVVGYGGFAGAYWHLYFYMLIFISDQRRRPPLREITPYNEQPRQVKSTFRPNDSPSILEQYCISNHRAQVPFTQIPSAPL